MNDEARFLGEGERKIDLVYQCHLINNQQIVEDAESEFAQSLLPSSEYFKQENRPYLIPWNSPHRQTIVSGTIDLKIN